MPALDGKMLKATSIPAGKYGAGSIVAADIASDAVTTIKILNANVTTAKLATGAVTANELGSDAVTTVKILDANVTTAKLAAEAVTAAKADIDGTNGNWVFGTDVAQCAADPTVANALARKSYVDSVAVGLRDFKDSVRVATAAALPANTRTGNVLTASVNGALAAQDGITLIVNDRILVKDEVTGANNGLYYVSAVGDASNPFTLTRVTDADASAEVTAGMYCFVSEGTANGDSAWVLSTNDAITLNTTALTFTQFSGLGQITAGAGLTKTGNTIDAVAGNGIVVNANDIAIDYETTAGNIANVGTAAATGSSNKIARADHVHKAFFPTTSNKDMAASLTTADNQEACATTVAATPAGDGYVQVFVNGLKMTVGDGVKTKDCYFSADAGTTAKSITAIAAADKLYWVGSVAGFQLATTDKFEFDYVA